MTITIRNERPEDYRRVEEVTREAFWNLYVPGCNEHVIVHKLRTHEDYIPELTFVLEADGDIAGSIFFSHSKVAAVDGGEFPVITFGPVSIVPGLHRQGLGRSLITHSLQQAKKSGYRAVLILGYPYHYEPYGFKGGKKYGIHMPDGNYYKGLQALPLFDGALDGISGQAVFSPVFEVSEEEAEAYDRGFPFRQKQFQESQNEFAKASVLLDSD